MSDRNTAPSRQEDKLLMAAALLAQSGSPDGPPPGREELRDWARGRLHGARLAEVESHIAFDPAVFDNAMAQRRANAKRGGGGIWPAALAAAAAAVLGLTLIFDAGGPPRDAAEPVLRSASGPHPDWRVAAFRSGYTAPDAEAADLRTAPGECLDGDDCERLAAALTRFGQRVAQLNAACARGGPDADQRAATAMALRADADSVAASLELAPWRGYLTALADALGRGREAGCAAGDDLHRRLGG